MLIRLLRQALGEKMREGNRAQERFSRRGAPGRTCRRNE